MKAIDLFAGAGGLSIGLIQAGIEVVAAVEMDPDCCESYRRNVGDHIIESKIEDIDPRDLPACDLIAGGPPCQGFSHAGKRDPKDPRNLLWREYMRIVETIRPAYVLLENVRGMLSAGEDKPLILAFRKIGYRVTPYLVNVADYGVPQKRYRVFYIGNRLGLPNPLPATTHAEKGRHLMFGLQPWVTVRQALGIGQNVPSHTIRAGAKGQPGYHRKHQGGYALLDEPSATIHTMDGGPVRTDRVRMAGYVPDAHDIGVPYLPDSPLSDDVISKTLERLEEPANTISVSNRRGVPANGKHLAVFLPVETAISAAGDLYDPEDILDSPSSTIRGSHGHDVKRARSRRPSGVVYDLPYVVLDEPSPTICAGKKEVGGGEPIRHRLPLGLVPLEDMVDAPLSTKIEQLTDLLAEVEDHWLADAYEVAPTIQCDPRVSVPGHHGPNDARMMLRRLTPRECAILQDFPVDFEFCGTNTSKYRQIGNACPAGAIKLIGLAIKREFERHGETVSEGSNSGS